MTETDRHDRRRPKPPTRSPRPPRPPRRPRPSRRDRDRDRAAPEAAPRASRSSSTAPSRPSAAARRPWCGCAWCPAPASSTWTAARLEAYFPNKVHQQLIKAPLVTVDRVDSLRHLRPPRWWRPVRAGRRAAPGHRPCADPGAARGPAGAEEGRLPDPRPACHRAQEVRPQEGPQGASVQQALIDRRTAGCAHRTPGGSHFLTLGGPERIFGASNILAG